ncbi:hypothetical protein QTN47_01420 [Danxiaibacter flavus]|uniref:Uncharacterized protein n=1 Tax=Danxiaibacter flavus TaxID=3049108 RepID=A0ABV3ZAL8_9BACT|nr:hypothetical protein QNM32_01420 [Chitinophagaceae bacterium DXS]
MKQRIIKYKSDLFGKKVTLIVDENLNKLRGKTLAPKKLDEANATLKKLQHTLPL